MVAPLDTAPTPMPSSPSSQELLGPHSRRLQRLALSSAIGFRDFSRRPETSLDERRSCRVLMREQALYWRRANPSQRKAPAGEPSVQ